MPVSTTGITAIITKGITSEAIAVSTSIIGITKKRAHRIIIVFILQPR